jgi:excisionase family DNA binding protein
MQNLPRALRKEEPAPLSARIALSLAEAARLTGLSVGKLRLLARAGKLKTHRCGRRILVRPEDLEWALFSTK